MKTKHIFLKNWILGLMMVCGVVTNAQIYNQVNFPSATQMRDFDYVSNTYFVQTTTSSHWTTTNAGQSWSGLSGGGFFRYDTDFPSPNFGISVGSDGDFRTRNLCSGWSNIKSSNVNKDLLSTDFIKDSVGYACGKEGSLIYTADQGTSWKSLVHGAQDQLNDLVFLQDSLAYTCGANGLFYRMKGDTITDSTRVAPGFDAQAISFRNDSSGFIVGLGGLMFETVDYGKTWIPKLSGTTENLFNVFFNGPDNGYVIGDDATILRSTDGGANWTSISNPGTYFAFGGPELRAIDFLDLQNGIVGGDGYTFTTTDGGVTWSISTNDLDKISFATETRGFAVGLNGAFLETKDGGSTWSNVPHVGIESLHDVHFVDANRGYIVGSDQIFTTIDGGDNWTKQSLFTSKQAYCVVQPKANVVLVSGSSGLMKRSTDNGNNFVTLPDLGVDLLFDMKFPSGNIGYVCSQDGEVFKTTDAGATWNLTTTGVSSSLRDLHFINDSTGWAVGGAGKVLFTKNGGTTWTVQYQGGNSDIYSGVQFVNDSVGVVVGLDGLYIYTKNQGATWTEGAGSSFDYVDIYITPGGKTFCPTRNNAIAALGNVLNRYLSDVVCTEESQTFTTFQPNFWNDSTITAIFEFTPLADDFSSATTLATVTLDSSAVMNFSFPKGTATGVYKTRLRWEGDASKTSLEKRVNVKSAPDLTVQLVDSNLVASSPESGTYAWYKDLGPGYLFAGTGDTLLANEGGEYYVRFTSTCCEITSEKFAVRNCNGTYVLALNTTEHELCFGDSLEVGTKKYDLPGEYKDTLQSSLGCDSIVINTLSFKPEIKVIEKMSICFGDSTLFEGTYYSSSDTITMPLIATNGCDSIRVLELMVMDSLGSTQDTTICQGTIFTFNGKSYDQTGNYIDTLQAGTGCDSLVTIELMVTALDTNFTIKNDSLISTSGGLTYAWFDCESMTIVPNATDSFLVVQDTGRYAFIVSDGTCTDTSACYLVEPVGISEVALFHGLELFPNPSSGILNIRWKNTNETYTIQQFNLTGQLIQEKKMVANEDQKINVGNTAGVYLIKISSGGSSKTFRISVL